MDFSLPVFLILIFLEASSSAVLLTLHSVHEIVEFHAFKDHLYQNDSKIYVSRQGHLHDFKTLYPNAFFTTLIRYSKYTSKSKIFKVNLFSQNHSSVDSFVEVYFSW